MCANRARIVDFALAAACAILVGFSVLLSAGGCEFVTLVLLCILLFPPIVILGSLLIGWQKHTGRSKWGGALFTLACLLALISISWAQWPLRISYHLSQGVFDTLAAEIRAGETVTTPRRVGLFTIRKTELTDSNVVCLWTHPLRGGNTGFVQCAPTNVPFNLWSMVPLDHHWQFISED